jgi:PAS domain S-box-containing protein
LATDLQDMTGYEVCERLTAQPSTADIPILFISPSEDPQGTARIFAAGGSDFVTRPFQEEVVLARVETHLALHSLHRQLEETRADWETDRAERLHAAQALQEAEKRGRQLIENLSEVIYAADADGILTYVSPAIEPFLGYSPSEVVDRPLRQFIHLEDLPGLDSSLGRILAGESAANEYRILTKAGKTRWVRTSSQPMLEGDLVIGLQGVLVDITELKQADERIRQQNEFLTSVLESLTHPFYVIDVRDYRIQMANSAARVQGWSGSATCYALTHGRTEPCDTAEHPCPLQEVKRTGQPVTVEHIHYNAAGEARNIEVRGYPLFDSEGNVSQVIEYALDVTERKQAEQALRQSERQYRQLLEALQEGIWVIDQEARTTFVNRRMAEMLGYTVEEMEGQPLFSFMDERGVEITQRNLERRAQGIREQHDFEFLRKDGSRLYALLETSPVYDDDGNYIGGIAGIQDISERRQAEKALQRSETLLNETQRLAKVGGWELDLDSSRVTWTEEVYRIHELPPGFEPTLDTALDYYHPEDRPRLQQAIRRAADSGQPWDLELRFITATGKELWVRAIGRAEHQDGRAVRLSGTFQDITERKQADQALQEAAVAAERNRLARDLHDSVTQALFSASLVAEVLPQVWQRDPAEAQQGLDELRLLTRGALAEMRTMLLELRPAALIETKLHDLLWQLTEAVTGRTQLVAISGIEPAPSLPPDVQVTFYRVAQEALNNVVKHAEARHVTVGLHASPPLDTGRPDSWRGQLILQVRDDGRGFDPGEVEPGKLGLGIMRERAESTGAMLTIESRPGRGTLVTLAWQNT